MNWLSCVMQGDTRSQIFIVTVARFLILLLIVLHFVLHVLTDQCQVLEVFFHYRFLSRQLRELLAVLVDHIQSSIKHADLVPELSLARFIASAIVVLALIGGHWTYTTTTDSTISLGSRRAP